MRYIFSGILLFICLSGQITAQTKSDSTKPAAPAAYVGPKGCPNALTDAEFDKVKKGLAMETDKDAKMMLAKKTIPGHCFLALQAKELMGYLDTDDERLEFAKVVYAHIYDQAHYPVLSGAFTDKSYAEKYREYVNSLE
jgi:hypothetical protein